MSKEIDLGRESEYGPGGPISVNSSRDKVFYPEFHYAGPNELDLPKEGTMTIKFCVTREVEETRGDKDWYQCDIQVEKILSVKGEKDIRPSKRDMSAEDALDALARELSDKHKEPDEDDEEGY